MREELRWTRGRAARLAAAVVAGVLAALVAACSGAPEAGEGGESRTLQLVVVLDGLRPDYVVPDLMPRLDALAEAGIRFRHHHSVFPTVTRVNASSIVTGAYPESHGLLGNTIFSPAVDATKGLDTSDRRQLVRFEAAEGRLLDVPDLAQTLADAGKRFVAASAGSTGSAYLLNHRVRGGALLHPDLVLPPELETIVHERLGEAPPEATPNAARNRYAVDLLLEVGLPEIDPDVAVLWLSDPDHTAHEHGIGAPETEEALRKVDAEVGRLLDELAARGRAVNVLVTSDHGFSTHLGGSEAVDRIVKRFARRDEAGRPDLVRAGAGVYDLANDPARVRELVAALQASEGVGAIFTSPRQPRDLRGSVAGTLSFEAARWGHERAGAILVSADSSDAANAAGWPGSTSAGGVAGHGSSGAWDIHNTLVAAGPDLKAGLTSEIPTANVDLAPTLCRLLGLEVPASMTGRVLEEALASSAEPAPEAIRDELVVEANAGSVHYRLTAYFSEVGDARYLDDTAVERTPR